jgi:hypothetical protein
MGAPAVRCRSGDVLAARQAVLDVFTEALRVAAPDAWKPDYLVFAKDAFKAARLAVDNLMEVCTENGAARERASTGNSWLRQAAIPAELQ